MGKPQGSTSLFLGTTFLSDAEAGTGRTPVMEKGSWKKKEFCSLRGAAPNLGRKAGFGEELGTC